MSYIRPTPRVLLLTQEHFGNATKDFMEDSGIWKVEVQDDAKPTPMNEANPRTKIHPAPNVNSVEAEKLSPTSLRIISSEVYT